MAVEQEKFLQIYGTLLVRTWEDDALKQRFMSTPADVLKEFGLDPGQSNVKVISPMDDPTEECTPESAVRLWNKGLESGEITFVYPNQMPEGAEGMELSIQQMSAVAGGGCCCTCTPCCSCS